MSFDEPLRDYEGVLPKCSNDAYHKLEGLSSSDIKWMLETPAHFKRLCLQKHLIVKEPTSFFDLGSSAHECFLEQDTSNFVALPEGLDLRKADDKIIHAKFKAENEGKRIITHDQLETVKKMFDVIADNKICSELVSAAGVQIEESFLYMDEPTGLKCKYRPDVLNTLGRYIVDYKTAVSASPHEFARAVARYHYHLSAAHYLQGVRRLNESPEMDYFFIVQEKTEPYAVAIYQMNSADIFKSFELRGNIMAKIKRAEAKNSYPDWSTEIRQLSVPNYGFDFKEVQ